MSRTGWSTSNFLRYAGAVASGVPVTMACWANTSVATTLQSLMGIYTSSSSNPLNRSGLNINVSSNKVNATAGSSSAGDQATTSTTFSTSTWFHACGVFASTTSRAAYLNGAGKGTNTTSNTQSGMDRTSIGASDGTSGISPFAPAGTGYIAEAAIWNVALTDAEVAVLASGISPLQVRPGSLIAYWPLIGNTSPEINLVSTASQTIQGSLSAAAHPRIIMPPRQGIVV